MDLFEKVMIEAEKSFLDSRGSHDWDHTLRVYNLCLHIGEKEKADLEILKIAAILHDIARVEQDDSNGKVCHAQRGAVLAREFLKNFEISNEEVDRVVYCIQTHRFRGGEIPRTKEAKILFDADKLDSIGAVGIGRAFLFAGEIGAKLHDKDVDAENTPSYSREDTAYKEYLVKLINIKDMMFTKEGKRIAQERHKFMEEFFERLNREVEGEI